MLASVSVQCFESLELIRPTGEALKEEGGVEENRYRSGRIIEIPAMQRGTWRMIVSGRGVFSAIIHVKSDIAFGDVEVEEDRVRAEIKGSVQAANLVRISGLSEALGDVPGEDEEIEGGRRLVGSLAGSRGSYRIMVVGRDQYGNPFQRVYPRLLGKLPN